jgi:beta-glucanase (GH16 family)
MYFTTPKPKTLGAYNIGGINASGQVPTMTGSFSLIDPETPQDALTKPSFADGTEWELVFSDEFNTPNRSFYPGDDPYWEAVDLHYWYENLPLKTLCLAHIFSLQGNEQLGMV